jgi:NadR type nicotinamide-nucleotide adenylyltransferase
MSKRFESGLVVGKFAPLHNGHLYLIEQAAAQCERLLIVGWSEPDLPNCDAEARRRWLATCCPQHESVVFDNATLAAACLNSGLPPRRLPPDAGDDATQQHFLAGLLAEVLQRAPDAMFASERYVHPCAAVLSERLQRPVSAVMVDEARVAVPVSARQIRLDPGAHRHHLPDAVWADWVPRICFLGGESSGKSTLAQALAQKHGEPCVAEYGRELWEQQGGRLDEADLLRIAREQHAREAAAASQAKQVLFCDTSVLTTLFYALDGHGRADLELRVRAERPYTLHVLCEPDFPFVQDGTRRNDAFRLRQHAWYEAELARRGLPVLRVQGPLARRMQQVEAAIGLRHHP